MTYLLRSLGYVKARCDYADSGLYSNNKGWHLLFPFSHSLAVPT
jgi:hypothetical protein